MIAIDTNVLVRVLTQDDPLRSPQAARLLETAEVFVAKTVLLETEWVLRYAYRFDRESIARAFRLVLGYGRLVVEDRTAVLVALRGFEVGLDFADALHLASSRGCTAFASFDESLVARARKWSDPPRASRVEDLTGG
ncbi:MAG: type II toxin-antitoxin system VapC family toxin [Thermoanaerobaculia bacterium]